MRETAKKAAWIAGGVIVITLFAPSLAQWVAPLAVAALLVAIIMLAIGRPAHRPSSHAFRRVSGYRVRPDFFVFPEGLLLALAVWEVVNVIWAGIGTLEAIFLGIVAGGSLALIRRFSPKTGMEVTKLLLGAIGFVIVLVGLFTTRNDGTALPRAYFWLVVMTVVLAVGAAGIFRVVTKRQRYASSAGSMLLAGFGILDLVAFVIAPGGVEILSEVHGLTVPALLIIGVLTMAVLLAWNPKVGEFILGLVIGLGAGYLLLFRVRLEASSVSAAPMIAFVELALVIACSITYLMISGSER